jgi:TRAP-type C4-dicarboxylate transport system substrate-binding protein
MKDQKSFLLVVIACIILALIALPIKLSFQVQESLASPQKQDPTKVYNWKFQNCLPPPSVATKIHPKLIEAIDKNTDGRIKIKEYPLGAIVGTKALLDSCATGVLEMVASDGGWWAGTIPAAGIESGLPFSYENSRQLLEIMWDYGLQDILRKEYAKRGVYLLTDFPVGGGGFGVVLRKPVRSLADLKGLKIRGFGPYLEFIKRIGASPVTMPLPETYMALTTGAVDGVITAWEGQKSFKFYEPCKYAILPSWIGVGCQNILVNMRVWESLPHDLRTIVQLTARDWAAWVK